jgi:hypothetical protein
MMRSKVVDFERVVFYESTGSKQNIIAASRSKMEKKGHDPFSLDDSRAAKDFPYTKHKT